MIMSAYEQGIKWNSCGKALEAREVMGPAATQADWWKECQRGDWLFWQLGWLSESEFLLVRPAVDRAVDKIVARAIRRGQRVLQGVKAPWATEWRRWARQWLNEEDRSAKSAKAMTGRIRSESRARSITKMVAQVATRVAVREVINPVAWATCSAEARSHEVTVIVQCVWPSTKKARAAQYELRLQARDIHAEIPEWPGH